MKSRMLILSSKTLSTNKLIPKTRLRDEITKRLKLACEFHNNRSEKLINIRAESRDNLSLVKTWSHHDQKQE